MMTHGPISAFLLSLALQSAPLLHEDLIALQARVVAVSGAAIGMPGGPQRALDSRLRLHRCPVPAQISTAGSTLLISCAAHGWRLHVPLVVGDSAQAIGAPAIRRGDLVALRIRGNGFAVVVRAQALEDGAIGARIRLRRANGPAAPIHAIVIAPGEAAPTG